MDLTLKQCTSETPCVLCPKTNDKSHWGAVGCHRGTFQASMRPIVFCDSDTENQKRTRADDLDGTVFWTVCQERRLVNSAWEKLLWERDSGLERLGHSADYASGHDEFHLNAHLQPLFTTCFPGSRFSPLVGQSPSASVPLNECILATAWDIMHCPKFALILPGSQTLNSLVSLLPRAAKYQEEYQEDQLIAQSLICLRTCLETMRVKASPAWPELSIHNRCRPSKCVIECVAQLEANITIYLEELSRVFFKKVNMRKKHLWWLSAFYSFCIQSYVKKCLMELEIEVPDKEGLASEEYLKLPVSLFIASSGTFDPLMDDSTRPEVGGGEVGIEGQVPNYYTEARIAVGQNKWVTDGISGSADYLRNLFEDQEVEDQEGMEDRPASNDFAASTPMPQSPQYSDSGDQLFGAAAQQSQTFT